MTGMSRWIGRAIAALAFLLGLAVPAAAANADAGGGAPTPATDRSGGVSIVFDETHVNLVVGDKFTLTMTIANHTSAQSTPYVAHLNVASLTGDVYVDPEDWSSSRSKNVPALAAGESLDVTWSLQAVNSGWFDVYVVLLPDGSSSLGSGPLVVSPPVFATVSGRQTANPGGAVPVVVGVPAVIGLAVLGLRMRRRRSVGGAPPRG